MKDRIIAYLAQNFPHTQIASMCGCTEARISQVASECAEEIEAERAKIRLKEEEVELEKGYMNLESTLLKQAKDTAPYAEFSEVTRALDMLIKRRQKPVPSVVINNDNRKQTAVILTIPQAAVPELILNDKKQAIAIGHKSLAALPSSGVRDLFTRIQARRQQAEEATLVEQAKQVPEVLIELSKDTVLEKMPDDF